MEINGIDTSGLVLNDTLDLPTKVPGRVLAVDADQLCYLAGCHDDEPFSSARENFHTLLATFMLQSGSDTYELHLTGADKGGRYEIATLKEYQANRKGKVKPKHLSALREYVSSLQEAVFHHHQEADDGMAQANYAAIKRGESHLSVICSADKDLKMCSGLHLNQQTGDIVSVDGYGYIELTEGKSKKVVGYGTAFFWAQLLMGDTADHIPGLPALGPGTLVKYPEFHTKALIKLLDKCTASDQAKADAAAAKIDGMKHKLCGAVATYNILKDCTSDDEAFHAVVSAYREHYGTVSFEYKDYTDTIRHGTAGSMLIEQAELLWMRRTQDDRVMDFFKDVRNGRVWV